MHTIASDSPSYVLKHIQLAVHTHAVFVFSSGRHHPVPDDVHDYEPQLRAPVAVQRPKLETHVQVSSKLKHKHLSRRSKVGSLNYFA